MGRTGKMWACEHETVVPDMILVSKGLASGLPVSAVIAGDEVAASWGPGAHVGTFAATALAARPPTPPWTSTSPSNWSSGPPSWAATSAEQLRGNCRTGTPSWAGSMPAACSSAWSSSGTGRQRSRPPTEAAWMLDFCVREGLLFEKGGYYYNRFQLIPPWSSRKTWIDRAVHILDRAMTMAEQRSGISFA